MNARFLILILMAMVIVPALAVPGTTTITLISGGNATFTATGASTTCWFQWGNDQTQPEWVTINQTTAGTCTATQYGSPYYPNQKYAVQSCDVTGCGTIATFTSGTPVPIPQTTFGAILTNISATNYNIPIMISQLPAPLLWEFDPSQTAMGLALMAGLFIMFYFVGLWLRQRRVELPVLLFMILLAFLLTPQAGFNWGLMPEFAEVAQMSVYVCLTGMVVSLFKKG